MANKNNKKPQTQTKQEEKVQSESQPEVNIAELVGNAVQERLEGLDDLVAKLVGQNINYEEITTSVLQHVEAKKPEGGEAPKWHRLDPEKCYQQCLDRALHIVTNGQTQVLSLIHISEPTRPY